MKFLLDTNVLIWFFEGSSRLEQVKELFSYSDSEVYISSVSFWEIAIKVKTGKLPISISLLKSLVNNYNFHELPMTSEHIQAYLDLPNLHRDPFDHMLLAQAISSPMRFITGDSLLADYSSLVMVV